MDIRKNVHIPTVYHLYSKIKKNIKFCICFTICNSYNLMVYSSERYVMKIKTILLLPRCKTLDKLYLLYLTNEIFTSA